MANKSFIVQYIIKARDQFSQSADKISKSSEIMEKRINRAKKSFKQFASTARKSGAIITATVTTPLLLMANSLKNTARDAVETRSKFKTVFKDIAEESQKSADALAKNFGLSGTSARQLLGDTGDLLSGFGFTGKAALDMSEKVNTLAVDLASFTNFSGGAEGASAALTKALLGERESLKSLGIAISEANVKAEIVRLAAKGQKFETLRQAKAIATLSLAYAQSKNAIGDFARTQQELANQERITSARLTEVRESLGEILIPLALKLTKAIRSLANAFLELSPAAKKTILIIGGIVAIVGPLLLALGSIALVLPLIGAAFTAMGAVAAVAFGPIGIAVAGLAAAAFLVIDNWTAVKDFFAELNLFLMDIFESIASRMDNITKGFSNVFDKIPSLPSFGDIKNKFFGSDEDKTAAQLNQTKVSVGVNVGLDEGLKQTTPSAVFTGNDRRSDVGLATSGAGAF